MKLSEAFVEIMNLATRLGVSNINKLPGCWEHQVDDLWFIAVNAHDGPMKCSKGVVVDPFNCYIEYNGWPAGIIWPGGGVIAAGKCANEDVFIDAIKQAGINKMPPAPMKALAAGR